MPQTPSPSTARPDIFVLSDGTEVPNEPSWSDDKMRSVLQRMDAEVRSQSAPPVSRGPVAGRGSGYRPNQSLKTAGSGLLEGFQQAAPLAASGIAAGLTGGGSLLEQMGGQAAAGLLSGGLQGDAAEGLKEAAINQIGPVGGAVLQKVAPALMEGALRMSAPIRRKFGSLGQLAVNERIMPTEAGAQKAGQLRMRASADKAQALRQTGADVPTGPIIQETAKRLTPDVVEEFHAGVRPNVQPPETLVGFAGRNPQSVPAHELDAMRSKWNDAAESSMRASHMGVPLQANEKTASVLADEAGRALEGVLPDYSARNARIMDLSGIRQAAQGRADIPARGLENAAAMYAPSPWRMLARLARMPAVMGGTAIAADALGAGLRSVPSGEALRAALMALLGNQ